MQSNQFYLMEPGTWTHKYSEIFLSDFDTSLGFISTQFLVSGSLPARTMHNAVDKITTIVD